MINPTGKKLEKLLFGIFDEAIQGVDTYNYKGSMWLIFTDEMRWVVEYTRLQTLWYNYYFFKQEMEIIGLDCIENKDLIQKWFESRFLNINPVENTIQNGVKDISFVNPYFNQKVEETIQNGVKHTQWNQIQHDIRVEDTIQNGVKKIRWNGEVGTHIFEDVVQNGVKEMKEISDSSLTSEIFKVNCKKTIRDGVKDTAQQKFNVSREVEDVIQKGVRHTESLPENNPARIVDVTLNGIKDMKESHFYRKSRITDVTQNGIQEIDTKELSDSQVNRIIKNGVKLIKSTIISQDKRIEDTIKNGIKDC